MTNNGIQQSVNRYKTLRVGDPVFLFGCLLGPRRLVRQPHSAYRRLAPYTPRPAHDIRTLFVRTPWNQLDTSRPSEFFGVSTRYKKPPTSPPGTPDRDMAMKFVSKSPPRTLTTRIHTDIFVICQPSVSMSEFY